MKKTKPDSDSRCKNIIHDTTYSIQSNKYEWIIVAHHLTHFELVVCRVILFVPPRHIV